MRRRLVQSTLAVALLAVILLGVPLAVAGAIVQRDAARRDVQDRAENLLRATTALLERGEAPDARMLERLPDGYYGEIKLTGQAAVSTPGRVPDARYLTAEVRSDDVVVRVERPREEVDGAIRRAILLVVVVAFAAVLTSVGFGIVQARRLSEPLVDLASRAERLGSGDARLKFRRYGLHEVDRVAEVLEHSAERVSSMLASERQFASDASHQLRTPLTALSMRLEEVMRGEDLEEVREEARIALTQVERLSGVVDHLLDSARQSRSATALPLDVDAVVHQQVQEWGPAFDGVGRKVVVTGERCLQAVATPGGIAQVLATLLENSLVHGAGTVTVTARRTATWVVLEVFDEGAGVPAHLGSRVFERAVSGATGTGLGLSLARDLAEADGGRLDLLRLSPPVFALFLREPGGGGAGGGAGSDGSDDAGEDAGGLSSPGAPAMPAMPGSA